MWIELVLFRFIVPSFRFGLWLRNITCEFSHQVLQVFSLDLRHISNQRNGLSVCFQWLRFRIACKISLLVEDIRSDYLRVQVQCFVLGVHVSIFCFGITHRQSQIKLFVVFLVNIKFEIPVIPVTLPHWCEWRILIICWTLLSMAILTLIFQQLFPEPICTPRLDKGNVHFESKRLVADHHWIYELASLFDLFVDVSGFVMNAQ